MDRVKGKVAIVTGSSSGIGKAIALLLAKEGAKIVVTADINEAGGMMVVQEILDQGGEAVFIKQDVTNELDWTRVVEKTLAKFGKLDILVNNAGVFFFKKIEDTSLEEWRRVMSVNADGVFLGTKHAIRAMKRSGGSIVNISSVGGIVGTADDTSAYAASKGAVRLFTKAAALECSKAGHNYNIRVNSVHPGGTETTMAQDLLKDEALKKKIDERHPIGHIGKPIDIAYAVLYLASEESRFVTGAELVIDGGWTAQ